MKRGAVILEAWEQRRQAELEAVVNTTLCGHCAWQLEGPVGETSVAYRTHLATEHPEVKVPARRKRHRPHRQFMSGTDVDTNIQNARLQGAATWAAPE